MCYLQPKADACWVQLGRLGDILIILPAMKHIFDTTGKKPVMMVCSEFAGLLDGVSYVTAWPMDGFSWFGDVKLARKVAEYWYDRVIIPKWWDAGTPPPPVKNEPVTFLNHLGNRFAIPASEWDSFQFSQWRATGFTRQQMVDWPLVIDQRNTARESFLISHTMNQRKPVVFYNFSGVSNPMPFEPEVVRALQPLRDRIHLVDMRHIRAERFQDLLGLFDNALCSINGDTATLHLAAASKTPHIAILANGGAGSVPKGNCVLSIRYADVSRRAGEIRQTIERLLQ